MEIGKKLKEARTKSGLTQENVSEKLQVSRQTISNWENEKSYPDIAHVIHLSDLYGVSLDALLKGDQKMIEHLEQSTNIVNSNKKLIAAIIANISFILLLVVFNTLIPRNYVFMSAIFTLAVIGSSTLFYQFIRKF
jgi:transcriptional regulator with XRE-family HTH domain